MVSKETSLHKVAAQIKPKAWHGKQINPMVRDIQLHRWSQIFYTISFWYAYLYLVQPDNMIELLVELTEQDIVTIRQS
jgi:hypothetical protein